LPRGRGSQKCGTQIPKRQLDGGKKNGVKSTEIATRLKKRKGEKTHGHRGGRRHRRNQEEENLIKKIAE